MKHPGMINEISKNNYEIFEFSRLKFIFEMHIYSLNL